MKIKSWARPDEQESVLGNHIWNVARLIEAAKNLPVMQVPLDHLNVYKIYERLTMREMVMHMRAVQDADLSCPIILDEDGEVMDGCHRIMKAMLQGEPSIKVVRFDENPTPCRTKE